MPERRAHAGLVWAALLLLTSCRSLGFGGIPNCPGALLGEAEIAGSSLKQLRVRVRAGDVDFPLSVVLQETPGERVVVGFNAFGAKVFSVVQRDGSLQLDSLPRAVLPVPPLNVVRDLHRALLLSAAPPAGGSGVSFATFGDVSVEEHWLDGALSRRNFAPSGASVAFSAEGRARVDHPACGYTLEIETLSQKALP
jgi:hypothetical protein